MWNKCWNIFGVDGRINHPIFIKQTRPWTFFSTRALVFVDVSFGFCSHIKLTLHKIKFRGLAAACEKMKTRRKVATKSEHRRKWWMPYLFVLAQFTRSLSAVTMNAVKCFSWFWPLAFILFDFRPQHLNCQVVVARCKTAANLLFFLSRHGAKCVRNCQFMNSTKKPPGL